MSGGIRGSALSNDRIFSSMKDPGRGFFGNPVARVVSLAIGLCFVVIILVWARAFYGSMQAYKEGEIYFEKNEHIRSITFFDRSVHWYTPFNPYVAKSAQRLWEICLQAEKRGDIQLALIAARTIRQGFLGARSFYVPGKDWIRRCDQKVASLMARSMDRAAPLPSSAQKVSEPDVFWVLLLEVGLFGWIGSVIGFLIHGLARTRTPKLRSKPAILWGALIIIFYALWITGMVRS
jgi:hypothetical protein